jgi:hypothetical protein
MATRRKQKRKTNPDLSRLENLEPESLNLTQELPIEEQILPQETGSLDEPVLPEEELVSLEDQILSRMDNKAEELAPAPTAFNSNFAPEIPEAVRDKIAAYLEEVTKKDKKNRAP